MTDDVAERALALMDRVCELMERAKSPGEAVRFELDDGDDHDSAIVTFLADGVPIKAKVRAHDAPLGLAIGDRCTLVWRGRRWWLSSVDSGLEAGGGA